MTALDERCERWVLACQRPTIEEFERWDRGRQDAYIGALQRLRAEDAYVQAEALRDPEAAAHIYAAVDGGKAARRAFLARVLEGVA